MGIRDGCGGGGVGGGGSAKGRDGPGHKRANALATWQCHSTLPTMITKISNKITGPVPGH